MGSERLGQWRSLPSWLQYSVIVLLVLGIFFRFFQIDRKAYWIDEIHTSLRTSGYTKTELVQGVATGKVITVADLQHYQCFSPDKGWSDTFNALKGNAEHTPLYFLMLRLWVSGFGCSVTAIRSLSALISLLVWPCLFWLCWELFQSALVGWIAVGLVAVSPLHVLYAQEARPYSLWTVIILLSSALLLRAIRSTTRASWLWYSLSVAVGFYTQLLFGLVAIAHSIYVAVIEEILTKRRLSKTAQSYLLAMGAGFLSLTPWLLLFVASLDEIQDTTKSLTAANEFSTLLNKWFLNINRILFDGDLGGANIILVALVFYVLYYLYRTTPRKTWLFILTLVAVPFLTLALPDLIWGGVRSIRLRYLFPSFLGIQIGLAYLFATQAIWARTWGQKVWRMVMIILVSGGIAACAISTEALIPWSKSAARSDYYPVAASIINRANNPLVVSDGPVVDAVALSYWLDSDVKLQIVDKASELKIAEGFDSVFLLNPTRTLQKILSRQQYQLIKMIGKRELADEDREDRLWLVKKW